METLQIGGVSARQLADDFGTPLYVYDEDKIIAQAKDAMENFSSDMFKTEVAYASKAFSSIALFKLLAAQGLGFDAVSGGELYGMSRAGVDMSKVYFHGNNKSTGTGSRLFRDRQCDGMSQAHRDRHGKTHSDESAAACQSGDLSSYA